MTYSMHQSFPQTKLSPRAIYNPFTVYLSDMNEQGWESYLNLKSNDWHDVVGCLKKMPKLFSFEWRHFCCVAAQSKLNFVILLRKANRRRRFFNYLMSILGED